MEGYAIVDIFLFLGIIGLVTFNLLKRKNNMNTTKRNLYLLSLFFTIVTALIPGIGYKIDSYGNYYFGFFSEIAVYRGGWLFSFNALGLFINFFLFYWFFKLILKLFKKVEKD